MDSLTTLQIGIIALLAVIVLLFFVGGWAYAAGLRRGREASARELDGLATSLRLDASKWQLCADERPYVDSERTADITVRQDRSRLAVRGGGDNVVWAGDGVAVGDQVAAVCVETGPDGRRMSTLLLSHDGNDLRGVRLTVSKKKGAALVHPVRLTPR